jgi:hypothetical protein
MTSKRIIGIDPGAHGALAFIDSDGRAVVHKTANTPPVDAARDALCGVDPTQVVVYLEQIGGFIAGKSLPGSAMFKMGHSAGYWEGMFALQGIRVQLVRPQAWQAGIPGMSGKGGHENKGDRKRCLRDEAIRRFPTCKPTLDTADALLIADFGRRVES